MNTTTTKAIGPTSSASVYDNEPVTVAEVSRWVRDVIIRMPVKACLLDRPDVVEALQNDGIKCKHANVSKVERLRITESYAWHLSEFNEHERDAFILSVASKDKYEYLDIEKERKKMINFGSF